MSKPIIYLNRTFRPELIQQIKDTAPDYEIKEKLTEADFPDVEISLGWDKSLADFLLSEKSNLKWVQAISAGVDVLPLKNFSKRDILLSNASGIHAIAITEHVIGVILSFYRGLITSVQAQEQKRWIRKEVRYDQLSGKKMLIMGTGHIASRLAEAVKGLGVEVYGINRTSHPAEGFIETYAIKNHLKIVGEMDIVVNTMPLTDETAGLFNAVFFDAMKNSAIFINVGRGPSVNTKDLAQALLDHSICFASLDVFEEEPLSSDSPLWEIENLFITSHISGMSRNFQQKLLDIFLPNLKSYIAEGELTVNQIELSKGY